MNKYKVMPYNEWGDENPKYEALKEMYEASTSGDELSGVRDILAGDVIEKPLNKDTIKKIVNLYRKWLNDEELAIECYEDYIFNNLKNQ